MSDKQQINMNIKIIDGYEDWMVSDSGEVFSIYIRNHRGKFKRNKPAILKRNISKVGYATVFIGSQIDKSAKRLLVHRLVAESFIPNPENKPQVNHINGIKTDNRIENLEWVTRKENSQHAHRNGLVIRKSGDNAAYKKISFKIASEIRDMCRQRSQRKVASLFGISQSLVSMVATNKIW